MRMKKHQFLRLLPLLFLLVLVPSLCAVDVTRNGSEWVAVNSSKTVTVTVTFQWTDLTLDRVQTVTRVIPPQGKVRICPVQGNTEPESVKQR
jgi:hypothetical protein